MNYEKYAITGDIITAQDLLCSRSIEIVQAIQLMKTVVRPIDFKRQGSKEVIVIEIELDLPNQPLVDIRGKETLAIIVSDDNLQIPKVYALRKDFPRDLPHTTLSDPSFPVDLCIFEEQFSELRHKWTGILFLREIKQWLELTSVKELHKEDQQLEPFLHYNSVLIHPPDIKQAIHVAKLKDQFYKLYTQQGLKLDKIQSDATHLPLVLTKTLVHTSLHASPTNLAQMVVLMNSISIDIEKEIENMIANLLQQNIPAEKRQKILDTTGIIMCIGLFFKRYEKGNVERVSNFIFKIDTPLGIIGEQGNMLEKNGDYYVKVVGSKLQLSTCTTIPVEILSPINDFLPKQAQQFNKPHESQNGKFSLIGVGALGSQFLINLARQGFGIWNSFDIDKIYPHNLTRHALTRHSIGENKSEAIAKYINTDIYPHVNIVTPYSLNILDDVNKTRVQPLLTNSEAIIDISTSVSIERHLAAEYPTVRKFTSFLNPAGNQLILLSEDKQRKQSLDLLEYQYYSELINRKELSGHLVVEEKRKIRYARGCRDITSRISQDSVSIYSGILAKGFKANLVQKDSKIEIWQLLKDLSISKIDIKPVKWNKINKQGWTIFVSDTLLDKIKKHRLERLPNETGGILLGGVDKLYRKIYITDTILSPKDSIEKPTLYIRGIDGVPELFKTINKKTNGSIYYLGEWHSHPDGSSVNMSPDDIKQFGELVDEAKYRGEPSLMLILGQRDYRVYIGNDKI